MTWRECVVGDFVDAGQADIQTGPFGTQLRASDYVPDGTPVINVRNIGFAKLRPEKLEYVNEQTAYRLAVHLLQKNDIVFARKGAVDRHLFVTDENDKWMQGSDCIRLRFASEEVCTRFVSYSLLRQEHQLWMLTQAGNKATMASLNHDIIKRISLCLPPLDIQCQIVSILSAYDDLIENNRRRMALLEESARLLYREWFVRLRFPGHERTRIIDGVPEGWTRQKLGELYDTASGGTPSRKVPEYFTGDIPWVKTGELAGGFIIDTEEKITEDAVKNSAAKFFPTRTVLVALYGATVGALGILSRPATTNQACCAVISNEKSPGFAFAYLTLAHDRERLVGLSAGAAQKNISQQLVRDVSVYVPQAGILANFNDVAIPLFEQIENIQRQNEKLCAARDLLLPRLMSGEIAV